MQIRVLFFGVLKDVIGRASDTITLPPGACVDDLLACYSERFAKLPEILPSLAISVNREYSSVAAGLHEGDEVALLPPVSGGSGMEARPALVRIVRDAIPTDEILKAIKHPQDGAAVVFEGIVRNNTRGRRTLYLDYEAYEEMALKKLECLAEDARSTFAVRDIAIVHRIGRLEIGETSVVIVVASAHRAAAFDACRWVIDRLKKTVPIWKKEYFEDGAMWADGEPFPEEIRGPIGTSGTIRASK